MKKRSGFVLLKMLLGVLLICAAFAGLEYYRNHREREPEPEVVRPVRTVRLGAGGSGAVRRYFGTVQGSKRVNLSFRVSGPLIELPAGKGTSVKKGDLLGRIDPRDFKTQLEQAEGVRAQARARYNEASANFKRNEELYRQKVIAAAQYDEFKTQLNVARSSLQSAEAQVTAAKNALADTELRAPFDGVIADRMVENYQEVTAKQAVISLQNLENVEIVFNVPDKDVARASAQGRDTEELMRVSGELARVYAVFDAMPDRKFGVKLKEFSAQADPRTQTYPVTVTMAQPDGSVVLPGMPVTVLVDFSSVKKTGGFSVPASALLTDGGNTYLWRFENGAVTRVPVEPGDYRGDRVDVSGAGLRDGDIIVTAGVHFLKEGQRVRLMAGE
ncbi:MAG: efflux RND transporter periplasmic adaptor subunit [Pyramidobacter sp.]|nr:efflux RND transporter periplasmic adaptor subunit [Pyramidobacter sp.]